jgi:hypothetical protein
LQEKRMVRRGSRASPYRNRTATRRLWASRTHVYGVASNILEKVKVGVHRLHLIRLSCRGLDDLGMLALCAEARRERVAQRES